MISEFKTLYESLGRNISYYRKQRRMTQEQLANIIGVDKSHLNSVELGKHAPSLDFIFNTCEILGVREKDMFNFSLETEEKLKSGR